MSSFEMPENQQLAPEQKTPTVAIMVPLSMRPDLTPDEEISMAHLCHHLGRYDKYLVVPQGSKFRRSGFEVMEFDHEFFGSAEAHKKLLFSKTLYERFAAYDFLMTYHLDALAFSDQLSDWCEAGYDYIGAPWIQCPDTPWVKKAGVGNSGFCLRRVSAALNVLNSDRLTQGPDEYWRVSMKGRPAYKRLARLPVKFMKRFTLYNNVDWHLTEWHGADDRFWSLFASHYDPTFRIAPIERALEFAFEAAPRLCLEMNGGRLPFGCHAWSTYDRPFWEEHLLPRVSDDVSAL